MKRNMNRIPQFYHMVLVSPWTQTSRPGLHETLRLPSIVDRYELTDWEDRSQRLASQFRKAEKNLGIVSAGVSPQIVDRILRDEDMHVLWLQPIQVPRSWNDRRYFDVMFTNENWHNLMTFLQREKLEFHQLESAIRNKAGQLSRQELISELKQWLNQ